ncbi:MAG: DUF4886 domain-containing protein [Lachnospiraceae bacterium]|nr:DUF4886 domain-containing protein [Lachnospiraceae bacterium]
MKKEIHVLSIGNSFSQDAQRYLFDLAQKEGEIIDVTNLCIGSCPLEQQYRNMMGDKRDYYLQINGHSGTYFMVSMKEALFTKNWDYITLQQASHLSYVEESYEPYLAELVKYIRLMCPKAKVLLHETWGYETGSERIINHGFQTYDEMFAEIKRCYAKAAEDVQFDGVIPSGTAFSYALQMGIKKIHRDTIHANLGVGRLILAMLWYGYLTGNDIDPISFDDFDEPVSAEEYAIAKEAVKRALL